MTTERALIARVEAAGPKELAEIVARPNPEEERVLRTHLGDARFERMRELVLQSSLTRAARATQGNVVVLHGIMGGELTYYETDADPDRIWLTIFRIIFGEFSRFTLDDQGASKFRIQATGILKRYYGELLLSLMQNWNTHAFWFDWRLDINTAAELLAAKLHEWFGDHEPVHFVGHSMGGLVARAFIKKYPERWQSMWDADSHGRRGGRLVMLGTPNHGSFTIPQLLMGLNDTLKKVALLDLRHSMSELLNIVKTFVGTYQMLPSPLVMSDMEKLYEAATYAPLTLLPSRFALAREFHEGLRDVIDPDRMLYLAGYNQPTYVGVRDWNKLRSTEGYEVTKRGDGTVPHKLGLLQTAAGRPVPTFYIEEEHGLLPGNKAVMATLDEILQTGMTSQLPQEIPTAVRGVEEASTRQAAYVELLTRRETEEARVRELVIPLQALAKARGKASEEPPIVGENERELANLLTGEFISVPTDSAALATVTAPAAVAAPVVPKIKIRLLKANVQQVGQSGAEGEVPIDAIAVGHYVGVKPTAAEKALDEAISQGLQGQKATSIEGLEEPDLLLTQFTERGIIRGELGQPFFVDDPRTRNDDGSAGPDRLIAVAGMGYVGRFGAPELIVLVRELCWSLGRLGKRHLATVLIGAGNGNLSVRDAVSGWLEGVKRALGNSAEDARHQLEVITFVENRARKLLELWKVLQAAAGRIRSELEVELKPFTPEETEQLKIQAREEEEKRLAELDSKEEELGDKLRSDVPTRLTVELDGDVYRFGAITETASVPERELSLDPDLVNDQMMNLRLNEKGRSKENWECS